MNTPPIIYPADQSSLILSSFVRNLQKAKSTHKNPKEYFQTLGIEIPGSIAEWSDLNYEELLDVTGCVISTGADFTLYEDLLNPTITYSKKTNVSQ